jgi:hypothetical protein
VTELVRFEAQKVCAGSRQSTAQSGLCMACLGVGIFLARLIMPMSGSGNITIPLQIGRSVP